MRPLEITLLAAEFVTLLVLAIPRLRAVPFMRYFAVVAVGLAIAQVLIEGPRWQMVPAYVLSGLFLVAALVQNSRAEVSAGSWSLLPRILAGTGVFLGALALIVSGALPALLPVFHFPQPSGPYGIGTVTYHWVDQSRPDMFATPPSGHRELMVQIWYPAKKNQTGARAPYVPPGTSHAKMTRLAHLPSYFFDHMKYVTTNAQPSVPMASGEGRFPVLIFSPGRGGSRLNNNFQVEELVSHGYVVVGIDHPGTVADVVFPDGRHFALDVRVAHHVFDESVVHDTFILKVFDYLGQDAVFTLNQLGALDKADPNRILTGRLDLSRVGIFGASLGGVTVAEACRMDPRFHACLILDVAMPPDVVQSGLKQPTMWISADTRSKRLEGWKPSSIREQENTVAPVFKSLPGDGYLVQISGMFHPDIADLPNTIPPPLGRWLGTTGPLDWKKTHKIINAYSLAFFDKYLTGKPEPLLDGASSPYPEVQLEKRR